MYVSLLRVHECNTFAPSLPMHDLLLLSCLTLQLECPVCRDAIAPGSVCLNAVASTQQTAAALHKQDEEMNFIPSPELKVWQDRMASLLWKQKQKGGVIDPNSEDDVIDETWVSGITEVELSVTNNAIKNNSCNR